MTPNYYYMPKLFFIFSLLLLQSPLFSQQLSKAQVVEDLKLLRESIQIYNPALYDYNHNFDNKSIQLIAEIDQDSLTFFEYYFLVSKLCGLSNEGHFSLGTWNDTIHKGIPQNSYFYPPFDVKILDDKIIIWRDYSNEQELIEGAQILSINGISAEYILTRLSEATPTDGSNKTWARSIIEIGFPWMYYFYIEQADRLILSVQTPEGDVQSSEVLPLTKLQQTENYWEYILSELPPETQEEQAFYNLRHGANYTLLTLPSFSYQLIEEENIKSNKLYKSIFTEITEQGTENLIIDLRGNTGGRNEFADDMVSYLIKQPSIYPYLKKTVSWDGGEKTYKMPGASKLAFTGTTYLLVDGQTYSAGSTLARYIREYGEAVVIGEETGTRYEGFAAGSSQYIFLPNTNVRIGIPRYKITFPRSRKQTTINRGMIPQYKISYSYEDLLYDRDLHLEKALELIGGE